MKVAIFFGVLFGIGLLLGLLLLFALYVAAPLLEGRRPEAAEWVRSKSALANRASVGLMLGSWATFSLYAWVTGNYQDGNDPAPTTTVRTTTATTQSPALDAADGTEVGYDACGGLESESELNEKVEQLARQARRDGKTVHFAEGTAIGCVERYLEEGGLP